MSTFVLVAGAWHGAWCWRKIVPLLEAQGHRVRTPELPATGADRTDPHEVTLESWARFLAGIIALEQEPVVLAGHSRGGAVISRAAELAPECVRRLVYVAGYLLSAGGTVAEAARRDSASLVPPNMIPSATGVTCRLRPSAIREALFGECPDADYEFALANLTPEPLKPLVTPLEITDSRFGSLPRVYVECSRDRTVSLAAQRAMQAAMPCAQVFTLASDHSPFFSHPEELAQVLGGL